MDDLVVAEYGEQFDARRQHGVPAVALDPLRHLVLRADERLRRQADLLALSFSLRTTILIGDTLLHLRS